MGPWVPFQVLISQAWWIHVYMYPVFWIQSQYSGRWRWEGKKLKVTLDYTVSLRTAYDI